MSEFQTLAQDAAEAQAIVAALQVLLYGKISTFPAANMTEVMDTARALLHRGEGLE